MGVKQLDGGKISVNCYAGCDIADIMGAIGMHSKDLYPKDQRGGRKSKSTPKSTPKSTIYKTYPYVDEHGELLYEVVRFVPKDFRQRRPDPDKPGQYVWSLKGVTRVLYRLPEVLAAITQQVDNVPHPRRIFLVEGEKDVDNLRALRFTATTNAGGAAKWNKSFTKVLDGTRIIILPDNDEAGLKHAEKIHNELRDSVILKLPGLGHKQDVSDWIAAGGTREALIELANRALVERDARPPEAPIPKQPNRPFTPLGYNDGRFFFMSEKAGQIIPFSVSTFKTKQAFFQLAPLEWWELHNPGENGVSYTAISNALMEECYARGLYDPDFERGRGAWVDDGRIVLHQGDELIVDGEHKGLLEFDTGYFYPRGHRLKFPHTGSLSTTEGQQLISLCGRLRWENPDAAILLAGWIALAPICGALRWRPHLWITGPSGSGKTWIMSDIIAPLLGSIALRVQSVTTEAGIRQMLGRDARPVLFDEAELEDSRSQGNMQRVLELARQASSESGGVIAKGSAGGTATAFHVRSMFCLSSIGVGLQRHADETRVSVLTLLSQKFRSTESTEQFDALTAETERLCTPEFSAGLMARMAGLANVVRENATTFGIAIAQTISSRRLGDQLGALLAGYWALFNDEEITLATAIDVVHSYKFESMVPEEEETDERELLNHLLVQRVRVDLPGGTVERTVGELVDEASALSEQDIGRGNSSTVLRRYGIKPTLEGLVIANKHSGLKELLRATPWCSNWRGFLRRIEGVEVLTKAVKWPGSAVSKCVLIPWGVLYRNSSVAENENVQSDIPF